MPTSYAGTEVDGRRVGQVIKDIVRVGPFLVCRHLARDPDVLYREALRLGETAVDLKDQLRRL